MSVIPNIQAAGQPIGNLTAQAASQTAQPMQSATSLLGAAQGASTNPSYDMPFAGVLREAVAKTQELNTQATRDVEDDVCVSVEVSVG